MDQDHAIIIGATIRRLRIAKGMTQEKLGDDSKLSRNFIGELERNEKTGSPSTLFKLAKGLDVTPTRLIEEIEKDNPDFDRIFEDME